MILVGKEEDINMIIRLIIFKDNAIYVDNRCLASARRLQSCISPPVTLSPLRNLVLCRGISYFVAESRQLHSSRVYCITPVLLSPKIIPASRRRCNVLYILYITDDNATDNNINNNNNNNNSTRGTLSYLTDYYLILKDSLI